MRKNGGTVLYIFIYIRVRVHVRVCAPCIEKSWCVCQGE